MTDEEHPVPDDTTTEPPLADVTPITPDAILPPVLPPRARTALDGFVMTELGNAERFVHDHQPTTRYAANVNWHFFNGMYWKPDDDGEAKRRMAQSVRARRDGLAAHNDPDGVKALVKWSFASETSSKINASLQLAQVQLPVLASIDDFDKNPDLLTCVNGTIDLRTSELREHDPNDMISHFINGHYEPDAKCPKFETFLDQISNGRPEWVDAIQRLFGYAATAHQHERRCGVFIGGGANGKSVLLKLVSRVLGTYAVGAAPSLLLEDRSSRHPAEVMALAGKRLVTFSEVPEASRMDAPRLKSLTGDDNVLTARFMNQNFADFKPTHTLIMAVNHLPYISPTDRAAWDRLAIFSFDVTFGANADRLLSDRLYDKERRGILRWIVEGARKWHEQGGLGLPPCVTDMTEQLKLDIDDYARWIADRCVLINLASMPAGAGYSDYKSYVETSCDARPMPRQQWARRMREIAAHRHTEKGAVYDGVGLIVEELHAK